MEVERHPFSITQINKADKLRAKSDRERGVIFVGPQCCSIALDGKIVRLPTKPMRILILMLSDVGSFSSPDRIWDMLYGGIAIPPKRKAVPLAMMMATAKAAAMSLGFAVDLRYDGGYRVRKIPQSESVIDSGEQPFLEAAE